MDSRQVYRVRYEAFSKFSNTLIRSRTVDAVAEALQVNLKYLFNFHVYRLSFNWNDYIVHITVSAGGVEVQQQQSYLPHELQLLQQREPMHTTQPATLDLPQAYNLAEEEQAELWAWCFEREECQIVISLLSGKSRVFTRRDITFVKLLAENLESKLLEICLFQMLDKQHALITSINQHQQEIIEHRTKEIAAKNEKLIEVSIMNAHHLREPLSRILGLITLADYCHTPEELKETILPKLKRSSTDLDEALKAVIYKATAELTELKA
ncbi:hypothetical protein ACMA1I_13865 [Pontibacter sp. 13R65]|uniref:hypothetical protein n=1 Tax=Pontibacter sp. 13R65 TaxID=3127458 RepID=UPI00301D61FF